MVLPLNYRRPDHVNKDVLSHQDSVVSLDEKSTSSLKSGQSGSSTGIPDALAFDKIINGGTCPPCTVRDFMNYLIYIEHSAENLQFFLWFRDYEKRFHLAPISETVLAPEWTPTMEDETIARIQRDAADKARRDVTIAAEIFKGTDFEKASDVVESRDPFSTPRHSEAADSASFLSGSQGLSYRSQASDAFAAAGAKQPFTIQPFRSEINRVISTYFVDNAPRQLNLSSREQKAIVRALSYTTHPSAFHTLSRNIETGLRRQAHPNFVRWTICNGNPARVTFARGLGVGTILLALIGSIILTLSSAGRGWRALLALLWVVGIATLITAWKGMCVVLHGLHHRHVRPWELFVDDNGTGVEFLGEGQRSFDSFGSSNSYEDEPWIVKYDHRFYVRKVFDREVWIQEPALRQIQDTIFLQSLLMAVLGAGVLTAIFVAVPAGQFY
ncbi:hypothetical protein F5Y18DRAFT_196410 [Xylariaceae sp. FL1019]|nr:hypothetical protein F5Y18DRAFT_196410 [Xylariaceae sp. FL1019]